MRQLLIFPIALLSILAFTSCQDEGEDGSPIPITQAEAQDVAQLVEASLLGRNTFATSYEQVDFQAQQEDNLNDFTTPPQGDQRSNCATVSFVTDPETFWPAVLTLNYGQGCVNDFGQSLGGVITATFDGLLIANGTNIGIDFADFSLGAYAVDGTYNVQNNGLNSQGQRQFTHRINGGELRQNGNRILSYEAVENHVQVAGQATNFFTDGLAGILDDVYEETVNANGIGVLGNSFTITTLEPLTRNVLCPRPVSGRLQYDFVVYDQSAILDFGNGLCDDFATVTIGGYSFTITL